MTEARARTSAGRSHRRRRPAQTRRPNNWWWAVAGLVAVAVLVAFAARGGGDGAGGSSGTSTVGFVGGDLHSLVVDPAVPGRLFVGGHQAVSVSTDGGRSWRRVGSLDDADAMGWAFTADAIWVSGHPGLSRSEDGGRTFARSNDGLPDTDVHALGAGANAVYGASTRAGVFVSTDGGRSWTTRAERAGQAFFGRILVDPADGEHLVAADARSGPVESTDGGQSWRPLGGLRAATWVSWAGPQRVLVASGLAGAATSSDGGRSWRPLELPSGATLVEGRDSDADLLYAAAPRGDSAEVWVSRDGGRVWARP